MELFLRILFVFAPTAVLAATGQLFPNLPGSNFADLEVSFTCTSPIYSGSVVTISSTDFEFLANTTCQLKVKDDNTDQGATAGSCGVSEKSVDIEIETGSPLAFTGTFSILLASAVNVPLASSQLKGNVEVNFNKNHPLCGSSQQFNISVSKSQADLSSTLSLSFAESSVMQFSYADFQLSFSANKTLEKGTEVWLQFSSDYDTFLGNVFVENGKSFLECEASFTKDTSCRVFNRGVYSTVTEESLANATNWLSVKNLRIPKVWGPAKLTLLSKTSDAFAVSNVTMNTTALKPLDLRCCYSFSKEERDRCTMADKSVCKAFGGNGGDYTADMNMIDFLFQQEMEMQLNVKCEDLFDDVTLVLLGKEPLCYWRKPKSLRLYLGANPEFRSQLAYFKENAMKLKDARENFTMPMLSVFVSYPPSLIVPLPVISGSTTVSSSVSAVLDCGQTKNTGRREIKCRWTYGKFDETNQKITITKNNLVNPVKLEVTNFWGLTASTFLNLTVKTDDVLSVQLIPSDSVFNKSSTIIFTSTITGSNVTDLSHVKYTWIVQEGQEPLTEFCKNAQRSCTIKNNALESRHNYTVTLMLSDSLGYAVKKFQVAPTPVHLIVQRPLEKISVSRPAVFDASKSSDPDDGGIIECEWVVNDNHANVTKGLVKELPRKVGHYTVKASCYPTGDKERVTSELFSLDIVNDDVPTVITRGVSTVNPGQTAMLSVLIQDCPHCTYDWIVPDELSQRYPFVSPRDQPSVLIGPNTLDFGRDYTFTVELDGRYNVSMTFYVNSPPVGGTFTVSPTNGTELLTYFALSARSWMDLEGNYPLTYQYFRLGANNVSQAISAAMLEYSISTVLGVRDGRRQVTLVCNVSDSLGASFTSSEEIELSDGSTATLDSVLKSISNSPSPSSALMTAVAAKDFISHSSLTHDQSLEYHEELLSAVNDSLVSTPLKTSQTFVGVSQVVGYLTSSAHVISQKALELSVAALQSAAAEVTDLERDQASVVLAGISNVATVGAMYQGPFGHHEGDNEGEKALAAIVKVVDGVCEALMARFLPDATPISIVTENIALNLSRFKVSADTANQTVKVNIESRVGNSEKINVTFSSMVAYFNNATLIFDSRVAAYSFIPNQNAMSEVSSFNNSISFINITVQDDEVTVTETIIPIQVTYLYSNVSKAGAVGTKIATAGIEGEMGTVDTSAKGLDVDYEVEVSFPSIDSEASQKHCTGFDELTGSYSSHNCETEIHDETFLCTCSSTSAVTLIPNVDDFVVSLDDAGKPFWGMTKWKYTKWSFSLVVVLALAVLISLCAAKFVDFLTEEQIERLSRLLEDVNQRMVSWLEIEYPIDEDLKNFLLKFNAEKIKELQSKSKVWKLWNCINSQVREFRRHRKAIREYVTSPKMDGVFITNGNPQRSISYTMRKTLAKKMNLVGFLNFLRGRVQVEERRRQIEESSDRRRLNEERGNGNEPDILISEDDIDIVCLTFDERIEKRLKLQDSRTSDESHARLQSLNCRSAILRAFSLPLTDQLKIFHVYDVCPVDSYWQTLVEKDLILSVIFYSQKQVSRATRVILLWDLLLLQLVMIGLFLRDFTFTGNDLTTVCDIFNNLNNSSFWKYFAATFIASFAWTTVLEIVVNISPKDIVTGSTSKFWHYVKNTGIVLGALTILFSLALSFKLASDYSGNDMMKWMIFYAISVFKDVLLGFHLKGFLYIGLRRCCRCIGC